MKFIFADAQLGSAEWDKINAAKKHIIKTLNANKKVAVHCAAGENRASLVAILVSMHFLPNVKVKQLIEDLREAKYKVNKGWETLTNSDFVKALLNKGKTSRRTSCLV